MSASLTTWKGHRIREDGKTEWIVAVECDSCKEIAYSIFENEPTDDDMETLTEMFADNHIISDELLLTNDEILHDGEKIN